MDYTKNLKVKDLKVLLCYYFGSEKMNGSPKRVELVETITGLFRKDREGLLQREGVGGLL